MRKELETKSSASSGQLVNQSSVQQLTMDGNYLHRSLRSSPTGDMHRQMWKFSLTLVTNVCCMISADGSSFMSITTYRQSF